MPGISWNSCCSPCPHGARRATHHMWSAFIFHGQVQSTVCPCEIAGKPPQGHLHLCGVFIKDPHNPPQALGPPLQGGDLCGIHSPPTCFEMLSHCSKSARESEVSSTSQNTAFIAHCSTKPPSQDTADTAHCSKPLLSPFLHEMFPWYLSFS